VENPVNLACLAALDDCVYQFGGTSVSKPDEHPSGDTARIFSQKFPEGLIGPKLENSANRAVACVLSGSIYVV
jgi:hypothetical protein